VGFGGSNGNDGILTIDTRQLDNVENGYITYNDTQVAFSMTRIIAHELGHVVGDTAGRMGTLDIDYQGRYQMWAVDVWENPIMRQLGDANNRMQYLRGCKFDRDKCPQ
jgi:hypothetical protein